MTIKPTKSGWLADIQPGGRGGRRLRKTFKTKREALEWEIWIKAQTQETPGWAPPKKDRRKLSTLADTWYSLHGVNLKRGQKTLAALKVMAEGMNDPEAWQITPALFADYRKRRIQGEFVPSTETRTSRKAEGAGSISPDSANRDLAYARALFNELKRLGEWSADNPVAGIRQLKTDQKELTYLDTEQIDALLNHLADDINTCLMVKVCLVTGARWGEAEKLRKRQVKDGKIVLASTKNGKNRAIPISAELATEIRQYASSKNANDLLFIQCKSRFEKAVEAAEIALPLGQSAHVLRHTFASHFILNGGNILTLQKILDHSSLATTMRYAHLAPDHLSDAMAFNPLAPRRHLVDTKE